MRWRLAVASIAGHPRTCYKGGVNCRRISILLTSHRSAERKTSDQLQSAGPSQVFPPLLVFLRLEIGIFPPHRKWKRVVSIIQLVEPQVSFRCTAAVVGNILLVGSKRCVWSGLCSLLSWRPLFEPLTRNRCLVNTLTFKDNFLNPLVNATRHQIELAANHYNVQSLSVSECKRKSIS